MRIIYIPSGYKRVYDYFDDSIIKELIKLKHQVKTFTIKENINKLKSTVSSFKPDLILTMVGFKMPPHVLTFIKQHQIPVAIWLTEDPYYTDKTLKIIHHYDYIFTIESACVDIYKKKGHKNVHHLALGVNPSIFSPGSIIKNNEKYDICLVGFPYPDRIKIIQYLLDHTPYSILTVGSTWNSLLANYKTTNNYQIIETWVEPQRVASFYNQSKIVLNTYRPYDFKYNRNTKGVINQSINNRTFEIASCGAFQLTELKPDLVKYFIDNKEIVSFTSIDDLLHKINYYLKHEKERKGIGVNARKRVLQNHTFAYRLNKMLNIIGNSL
ncbi:hypothetical protein BTR23_16075 [Alkalihalophilus pseudofirmus]|nr:hypothetical protein BTR23_16075 [Alkalihalophilus pseudofirmus]